MEMETNTSASAPADTSGANLLDRMKAAKAPSVLHSPNAAYAWVSKAIKLTPRVLRFALGKDQKFMIIKDFNIRAVTPGTTVGVALCTPSQHVQKETGKGSPKPSSKLLAIMGFAKFDGNVSLDCPTTFETMRPLHLCEDDYQATADRFKRKLVGWSFKDFTLAERGIVFVPSNGQDRSALCYVLISTENEINSHTVLLCSCNAGSAQANTLYRDI